jgi:hypothetical protein
MSSLRATAGAARAIVTRPLATTTPRAAFSHSSLRKSGGHESHYDPPGGWLFGVKPGEKYEKEGWEGPIYWGLCGGTALAVVAYAFKPDTRYVKVESRG